MLVYLLNLSSSILVPIEVRHQIILLMHLNLVKKVSSVEIIEEPDLSLLPNEQSSLDSQLFSACSSICSSIGFTNRVSISRYVLIDPADLLSSCPLSKT